MITIDLSKNYSAFCAIFFPLWLSDQGFGIKKYPDYLFITNCYPFENDMVNILADRIGSNRRAITFQRRYVRH